MAGKFKKKSNKLKIKKLQINFTNRWLYTLIVFFSLIAIGVGVYAAVGTTPNPGHPITALQPCNTAGEILKSDGTTWTCGTDDVGTGGTSLWTQTGSDIYYNSGKVSIGTTSSTWPLHVEGTAYIDDFLGIGVMNPSHRLHVNGTVRADVFVGSGSGLTNLMVRVQGIDASCDSTNDGLLRYRSSYCTGNNVRSSSFSICMRTGDSSYGWFTLKSYDWYDYSCNTDGCPAGQTYYECTGEVVYPGCYDYAPEYCYYLPGTCFLSGTKVLMDDGRYKNIEQVKEGEWIVSYDTENNLKTISKVAYSLVHEDVEGYVIINGELEVTSNHPMWIVNRQEWAQVHTIELGDILLDSEGKKVIVYSIDKIKGTNTVYNLQIEGDYNNYFAEDILVHNKVPEP